MTAYAVEVHADRFLQRPDIIPLATTGLGPRYLTVELVAIERLTVDVAVARKHDGVGACPWSRVTAILRRVPVTRRRATTAGEAADHLGQRCRRGRRGSRHRQDLCDARGAGEVWQRNGYRVHGVALAGRAAVELEHTARILIDHRAVPQTSRRDASYCT